MSRTTPRLLLIVALLLAAVAAPAMADEGNSQAAMAVRLKVVPTCTITHDTAVNVSCSPETPAPTAVHATSAPAALWTATSQADTQADVERIDIVF
ncbi:hypothetical protein SAMN05428989_0757 [Pseudoxanthomonas sp. GM95]|uniref:hypothetical protein n=1 Tax=Pseudoxanthomonas sp. GM95 TaxID=1881043 RepID=UPI0008D0FED5|nr:hypothetical protein [Pseudoxanthomonas sp. GM95]SEK76578.1 hypothetical protein SAMN05428989_0757 [Pseudoxanthomonas sp. GM95]